MNESLNSLLGLSVTEQRQKNPRKCFNMGDKLEQKGRLKLYFKSCIKRAEELN